MGRCSGLVLFRVALLAVTAGLLCGCGDEERLTHAELVEIITDAQACAPEDSCIVVDATNWCPTAINANSKEEVEAALADYEPDDDLEPTTCPQFDAAHCGPDGVCVPGPG